MRRRSRIHIRLHLYLCLPIQTSAGQTIDGSTLKALADPPLQAVHTLCRASSTQLLVDWSGWLCQPVHPSSSHTFSPPRTP